MTTIYDWLKSHHHAGFRLDPARLERGQELALKLRRDFAVQLVDMGERVRKYACYAPNFKHNYDVEWLLQVDSGLTTITPACTCPDWLERGRLNNMPCKHLLAVAMRSGELPAEVASSTPQHMPPLPLEADPPALDAPFGERVSAAIAQAVDELSARVLAVLREGYVPLLLGPTGCGKTSALRQAALQIGCLLVEHAGADSWSDSDLVGVEMPGGKRMPGPLANALTHARETGEPVLLFLDEFPRYNPRAQEALMRLLLPIPAQAAAAMGIPCSGAVRAASAPFWGEEWAPADLVHIALAGNPWGNPLDPALVRRTVPLMIDFDARISALFGSTLQAAIGLSWSGTRDGSLPLPIEYGELARANAPEDTAVLGRYLNRLRAIDPAAAGGFETLLKSTTGYAA
jgi:hypothetical protein